MQDLAWTGIFFIPLLAGAAAVAYFILRFRLLRHCRAAAEKSLEPLRSKDLPLFYASYYIKQNCLRRFFRLPPTLEAKLARRAAAAPNKSLPLLARLIRRQPHNQRLLLLYADLCRLFHRRPEFHHTLGQIRLPLFFPAALKADFFRLSALDELYQTDMHTASSLASRALKICQQQGFSFEEAECYQTLAQIYRISGVFDVAATMLREAGKIYAEMALPAKQAETEAYLGLVEIGRENYSAAAEYLAAAAAVCRKSALRKTAADIANWQGLACYLQKDMENARTFFAATLSSPSAAPEARAFAAEMLARLSLQQKDYPAALRRADEALSCHQKNRHRPGIFENLYLKAEIYYAAADYEQSAAVLTALIKEKSPPSSTYYPANAYTLLGLIYSETGRINLARTLFKQALDLESSLNRIKGAAVDYNNLAELSLREGHKEEAEKYLRRALEYAETLADKELINYLKSKL